MNTDQKYRSACDACHTRKIRCTNNSQGACVTCQGSGRPCVYSPRDEMGRPRKPSSTRTKNKRRKTDTEIPDNGTNRPTISTTLSQSITQIDEHRHSSASASTVNGSSTEELGLLGPSDADADESYGSIPTQGHFSGMDTMDDAEHFFTMDSTNYFNSTTIDESYFDAIHFNIQSPFTTSLPTPPDADPSMPYYTTSVHSVVATNAPSAQMLLSPDMDVAGISKQMTTILFGLRTKRKVKWTNCEEGLSSQASIFQTVTDLYRLIQTALQNQHIVSDLQQAHECHRMLHMLTATAISTIVDIYNSIAHSYTVDSEQIRSSLDPSNPSAKHDVTHPAARKDFSELAKIIHLDTMDFHLSKLRDALDIIQSRDLQLEMVDDSCGADIQQLRSTLQATASALRSF